MSDLDLLNRLQNEERIPFHIDYEAWPPRPFDDTLDSWFAGADWRAAGHRFIGIGQDGTGSIYAQWLYQGLEGEPPVVFLGSEGEVALVADSADDVARALADGFEWWPYEGEWRPFEGEEEAEEDEPTLEGFKAAVVAALGPWTEAAPDMLARAKAKHPDFEGWVNAVLGY